MGSVLTSTILAPCKPTENGSKAPCCGSSAIVVVVRRYILAYDRGAVSYGHDWASILAISCRNGSETVIVTADNSPTAQMVLTLHVGDNILEVHALYAHI
jgi:hypothetical protein